MIRMTVFPAAIVKYSMMTTSGQNKFFFALFSSLCWEELQYPSFYNIVPANLHVQQHFLAIQAPSRMIWTTFDSVLYIVELSGVVAKSDF